MNVSLTMSGPRPFRLPRSLFIGLFVVVEILFVGLNAKEHGHLKMHREGRLHRKNQFTAEAAKFTSAAVASDNHVCSEMGKSILLKGGSAVDSAITVQLCIEVINSHSTGISGGGFMLIYDKKSGNSSVIDFRETLPLKYKDNKEKRQGEMTLVPGVLRGLEKAHKKYGKLKWQELFEPVIALCENGFEIPVALGRAIEKTAHYVFKDESLKELFAPHGTLLKQGDILKRPKLARTYREIARNGADVFYRGKMAKQIVKDIKDAGGFISLKDLQSYKAIARRPLKTLIRGLEMLSIPPPGSGALVSLALKILAGFNWTRDDIINHNKTALTYHRIIESFKFAYAPSTFLGDPKFSNYTKDVVQYMLDDKVAESLRSRIDNKSHTVDYYGPHSTETPEDKRGTTHISVLGPGGDAVSLTSTINGYFGSKLRSKELGFFYNNELADFSEFWPKIYKLKKDDKIPGKRPASNSCPTIFLAPSKNVSAVLGAAGGHFIPTSLIMTIANWLFFGDNLKEAVTRPRLHCQLFPPTVVYEPKFPSHLIQPLHNFAHSHVTSSTYDVSGQQNAAMGIIQAIARGPDGGISAECDYRKGGLPAGF